MREFFINVFGKLFRCKTRKLGEPQGGSAMEKKMDKKPYSIPELRKNYYNDPEVMVLSYYLKTIGLSQNLNAGDIYYVKNEEGMPKVWVYTKNEADTYEEFDFLSSGNYFRMITQEEALTLIKYCGYNHDPVGGIDVQDDGETRLSFMSPTLRSNVGVNAGNIQAAYLKAAYLVAANNKMIADANTLMEKDDFFKGGVK